MRIFTFTILLILCFLIGCNNNDDAMNDMVSGFTSKNLVSETTAGDYILRLVSEKMVYEVGEEVKLEAKVKYIGEQEKKNIHHGESLFLFDIRENTRGIHLPYNKVETPHVSSELERNSWYVEHYVKEKAHTNAKDKDSINFLKEIIDLQGFPVGEYEIEVTTNFFTKNEHGQREDHIYSTSVILEVIE